MTDRDDFDEPDEPDEPDGPEATDATESRDGATEPAVIAHRGFAGVAPENTVGAAVAAAERSETAMVEVDVRPAADGTPVVIHDARLEGDRRRDGHPLTDAAGRVAETPLDRLTGAEVLGSGETVPTLERLLGALPGATGVVVELKGHGDPAAGFGDALPADERDAAREEWLPFVERVVAACESFDGEVLFSSFYEGAIAALREVAPAYATAALVWDSLEEGLEVARRYDCEALHVPRNAIRGTALAETAYAGFDADPPELDVLDVAHEEGRTVTAWTVETWRQYADLAAAGVDAVIADYPGIGRMQRRQDRTRSR